MKVTTLWILQQDEEHIPLIRIQTPRHLGGKPKIANPLGAGLNTEPGTVIIKKCVLLTGKSDSLVTDGRSRQDTTFNIQLCTQHAPFSHVRHVPGSRRFKQ